jgi:hypothetical protein
MLYGVCHVCDMLHGGSGPAVRARLDGARGRRVPATVWRCDLLIARQQRESLQPTTDDRRPRAGARTGESWPTPVLTLSLLSTPTFDLALLHMPDCSLQARSHRHFYLRASVPTQLARKETGRTAAHAHARRAGPHAHAHARTHAHARMHARTRTHANANARPFRSLLLQRVLHGAHEGYETVSPPGGRPATITHTHTRACFSVPPAERTSACTYGSSDASAL